MTGSNDKNDKSEMFAAGDSYSGSDFVILDLAPQPVAPQGTNTNTGKQVVAQQKSDSKQQSKKGAKGK